LFNAGARRLLGPLNRPTGAVLVVGYGPWVAAVLAHELT